MSGGRGRIKTERPDLRGGGFIMLPDCLLNSDAFRTASFRARTALSVLLARHTGFNNGKIGMSVDALAFGLGCQNYRANSLALAELQSRGIIELTKDHPRGSRLAREYRLTFIPCKDVAATHDYLSWCVGDAGTGKKRVVTIANETCVSAAVIANETKLSVAAIANEKNDNHANAPFFQKPSFAIIATHIGNHVGLLESSAESQSETSRPDRKVANGSRFTPPLVSAAPSEEELRERVLSHLAQCGRGSQGRLAGAAGIPAGTFSKFLKHDGPLSAQARIRLTCAFPRVEKIERVGVVA